MTQPSDSNNYMPALTKSEFIAIIAELKEVGELTKKVNKLFRDSPLNTDFCNASGMAVCHDGIVVQLLDKLFNSGDLIEWWVYEAEYGECFKTITDNGQEIDLSTPERLYSYLIDTYPTCGRCGA